MVVNGSRRRRRRRRRQGLSLSSIYTFSRKKTNVLVQVIEFTKFNYSGSANLNTTKLCGP